MKSDRYARKHAAKAGKMIVLAILFASLGLGCTTHSPTLKAESARIDQAVFPSQIRIGVDASVGSTDAYEAFGEIQRYGFHPAQLQRALVSTIESGQHNNFRFIDDSQTVDVDVTVVSHRQTSWLGIAGISLTVGLLPAPLATYDLEVDVLVTANSRTIVQFTSYEESKQFWMGGAAPLFFLFNESHEILAQNIAKNLESAFADEGVQEKLAEALESGGTSRPTDSKLSQPIPRLEHKLELAQEDSLELHGSGTAFAIDRNGTLITNHHVVEGAKRITIYIDREEVPARIVTVDPTIDIALLKVDAETVPVPLAKEPARIGQEVFTVGFPNPEVQGLSPKYTEGTISSTRGLQDDPSVYQISVPIQPGNSGGPILTREGRVVGVAVASLNEAFALQTSGALPQNVNYALKATRVRAFLQEVGVELGGNNTSGDDMHHADLVDRVQESVFLVSNYQ
jgi:S1-C subfamily serine protease